MPEVYTRNDRVPDRTDAPAESAPRAPLIADAAEWYRFSCEYPDTSNKCDSKLGEDGSLHSDWEEMVRLIGCGQIREAGELAKKNVRIIEKQRRECIENTYEDIGND